MNNFKKILCINIKTILYKAMKYCESISGEDVIINANCENLKFKIKEADESKKDLEFLKYSTIGKDEHIDRLYMFIAYIAHNFRKKNYDKVDEAFKKINL